MRINTNIAAFNAYRNLSTTNDMQSKSLEKLSSGFRINRAADDAAGLAVSEGLRSQIGGLKQGVRNAQDGISVVQTAEGALTETHSILQRMRDLSVQASNSGSLNSTATENIQSEVTQLKAELDRIASTTQFNGKKLLDGSFNGTFQVGANVGESINVTIGTAMSSSGLGVSGVDVTGTGTWNGGSAAAANTVVTSSATAAATGKLTFGTAAAENFGNATGATAVAAFEALDGTIAFGGKSFDLSSVDYSGATTSANALTKINTAAKAALGLTNDVFTVAGATAPLVFQVTEAVSGYTAASGYAASSSAAAINAATGTFSPASGAPGAIDDLDTAIQTVSTQRANLGAIQNRFDHTINNLNVAVENLSASESRIRDTDMALEMVSFTKSQILSQAGTAMLAQANQTTQGVLSLLR